ncbi:phage holin family protein, partial [Bradyrhizobium sp. NBAIM08]|uniref:phage holin family protein n=1 Tax=Bradyrhizobium sp. NBAIM08 TaxID=2793815 RepID=UPI001CD37486
MRYFIIRVLVNALALALTILVLPWIDVRPIATEELAATYILLGLVFGLINALVRPAVLFFTARLLIATMGLFV